MQFPPERPGLADFPGHDATILVVELDRLELIARSAGAKASELLAAHLGRCVETAIAGTARVFHTGAAQFAVLFAGRDAARAERLAGEIFAALSAKSFAGLGVLSASAAVAQRFPGESLEQWWSRADDSLLQAKAAGGGRVVADRRASADDLGPLPVMKLVWQDRFACGHATIDRQHRELFDCANRVLAEMRSGGAAIMSRLDELVKLALVHFRDEEQILARAGYRDLARHARSHAVLAAKALRLRETAATSRIERDDLVRFLLGEVVADHMLAEDRLFVELFAAPPSTG
jgi:hemerythrin-like metal-binding protein